MEENKVDTKFAISVKVTAIDRSPSHEKDLNYVCRIYIQTTHGKWKINKSFKHFEQFHHKLIHIEIFCGLNFPSLPTNKGSISSLNDFITSKQKQYTTYLSQILRRTVLLGSNTVLDFIKAPKEVREIAKNIQKNEMIPLKKGMMKKEGQRFKWKGYSSRYFVLLQCYLLQYYENEESYQHRHSPKGSIDLTLTTKLSVDDMVSYGINIKTPNRMWKIQCFSKKDHKDWYDEIKNLLKNPKYNGCIMDYNNYVQRKQNEHYAIAEPSMITKSMTDPNGYSFVNDDDEKNEFIQIAAVHSNLSIHDESSLLLHSNKMGLEEINETKVNQLIIDEDEKESVSNNHTSHSHSNNNDESCNGFKHWLCEIVCLGKYYTNFVKQDTAQMEDIEFFDDDFLCKDVKIENRIHRQRIMKNVEKFKKIQKKQEEELDEDRLIIKDLEKQLKIAKNAIDSYYVGYSKLNSRNYSHKKMYKNKYIEIDKNKNDILQKWDAFIKMMGYTTRNESNDSSYTSSNHTKIRPAFSITNATVPSLPQSTSRKLTIE